MGRIVMPDSINFSRISKPKPRIGIPFSPMYTITPCPASVTGLHGNYKLKRDDEDDEGLHHFVTCGFCFREASAGIDINTGKIELFYGNFDDIWSDDHNFYSHHSVPVVQPNGEEWCLP